MAARIIISNYTIKRLGSLVYLSLFCTLLYGQTPDSSRTVIDSTSLRGSLPENPLATVRNYVQQWRAQLNRYYTELDSVKRILAWQRQEHNQSLPGQVQPYITSAIPSVQSLRNKIKVAQQQVIPPDSTALSWKSLQDSVVDLATEAEQLLVDLTDIGTKVKQEEQVAQSSNAGLFWSRLQKVILKNLEQDGLSTRFYGTTWDGRLLLVLVSLAYLYWLYLMRRRAVGADEELPLHRNQPWWIPLLKFAVFFLLMLPLTSFRIPVLVLELSYLLLFTFLYILLHVELSVAKVRIMRLVFLYYIALLVIHVVLDTDWLTRGIAVLVNLAGLRLVWALGKRTDKGNPFDYLPNFTRWVLLFVIALAIVFNLAGFLNLTRICSITAGIGLLQALSLRAFRDMLAHDLVNSYERAAEERFIRCFDKAKMVQALGRIVGLFAIVLVLIVWTNSLHLTSEVRRLLDRVLHSSHNIGSISYTYGDVLLAIAVITFANWIQKNLKDLLGGPTSGKNQRRTALLPLVRVFIFIIGFLIGIRILGLGMDKLTVIIGALSVGIGLGLQNIINNFVSGVILVFERPFKVGDYVELADKKGQVLQIGIRSSTLLTDQGSQVIIPNADLLSGRLVNWTFDESDIRLNLQLTFNTTRAISEWKQWLLDMIPVFDEIDPSISLKIYTKDITTDAYILSMQVGIHNVQQIEIFRSKFLETVKIEAAKYETKVTSA